MEIEEILVTKIPHPYIKSQCDYVIMGDSDVNPEDK